MRHGTFPIPAAFSSARRMWSGRLGDNPQPGFAGALLCLNPTGLQTGISLQGGNGGGAG